MNKALITITALAVAALAATFARADEQSQSTKSWLGLKHIQTEKEFTEIPKGATVAMSCPMCKSVTVLSTQWKTTKPSGGTIEKALVVHQCPGCGGKMTTVLKQTKMVHTCTKCGDDSAFCCATKPGEKTEGMKEK